MLVSLPTARSPPSEDEAKDANIDGSDEHMGNFTQTLGLSQSMDRRSAHNQTELRTKVRPARSYWGCSHVLGLAGITVPSAARPPELQELIAFESHRDHKTCARWVIDIAVGRAFATAHHHTHSWPSIWIAESHAHTGSGRDRYRRAT